MLSYWGCNRYRLCVFRLLDWLGKLWLYRSERLWLRDHLIRLCVRHRLLDHCLYRFGLCWLLYWLLLRIGNSCRLLKCYHRLYMFNFMLVSSLGLRLLHFMLLLNRQNRLCLLLLYWFLFRVLAIVFRRKGWLLQIMFICWVNRCSMTWWLLYDWFLSGIIRGTLTDLNLPCPHQFLFHFDLECSRLLTWLPGLIFTHFQERISVWVTTLDQWLWGCLYFSTWW